MKALTKSRAKTDRELLAELLDQNHKLTKDLEQNRKALQDLNNRIEKWIEERHPGWVYLTALDPKKPHIRFFSDQIDGFEQVQDMKSWVCTDKGWVLISGLGHTLSSEGYDEESFLQAVASLTEEFGVPVAIWKYTVDEELGRVD